MIISQKTCSKCSILQSIENFGKRKQAKDGLHSWCKQCRANYRTENVIFRSEYNKQYRILNHEQTLQYSREYKKRNKEILAAAVRIYNEANKDVIAERKKLYLASPNGKLIKRVQEQNRRLRIKGTGGRHTASELALMFEQQNNSCEYCRKHLFKTGKNKYHVDHIHAVALGGTNNIGNIQLLCPTCNKNKHAKPYAEYEKLIGYIRQKEVIL